MIDTLEAAHRLIKAATGEENGDGMTVSAVLEGYAEPGYGNSLRDGPDIVVLGNWNPPPRRDGQSRKWDGRSIPERLGKALERVGAEVEWSDEWSECTTCRRAVRTSPDSYMWKPSYTDFDGERTCAECIQKLGADALDDYVNDPHRCVTWCEPSHVEQFGYVKWEPGDEHTYENGWHPGQTDDPVKILEQIHRHTPDAQVLFFLDEQSQFYIRFSAYVREPHPEEESA